MRNAHREVVLALSVLLAWSVSLAAQDQPASRDNSAKPLSPKELKKRQKQFLKELGGKDDWLDQAVPDIITPDERRAYLELSTNEERDQYKEIFWQRRNPEPESPVNTAKEEHYRRLAYADEHFASGNLGRKTDRGH